MKGFFSKKEGQSTKRPDGRTYSCASCGLYQDCKSPKLKPVGGGKKGILNIVSTPTETEDRQDKPFVGSRYKLIERLYSRHEVSLQEDCINSYALRCSTKKIQVYNIDCCRRFLIKLIETSKPRIVFLYGYEAIYSVIGQRWKKDIGFTTEYQKQTGGKWQGYIIPDQELKCWLVPVFDVDFLNDKQAGVEQVLFENNIKEAFGKLDEPFLRFEPPIVEYLTEDKLHIINTIDEPVTAFDYETTGIKPYAKGHRIVCVSIAYSEHNVYTFLLPKTREKRKPFLKFLQREDIKKIAQNLKYEDTWSIVRLKTKVENWHWDTMLGSHIIDNRPGIAGLKFQAYVRFGVIDYDSEIEPFLKSSDSKNGNAINRIMELLETEEGAKKLLTYCAWDSILEYRLFKLQEKIINRKQPIGSPYGSNIVDAHQLFHEGILALGEAERYGLHIDTVYTEKKTKLLTKKIKRIESEFFESKFYRRWKHSIGNKAPNLNSGDQLGRYLYSVLKLEPQKETKSGKGSTDEEALQLLKIPELDLMLERSKLRKLRDTYLKAFTREQTKEILHPFFNLHIARTYRSSSSNPNFQNIPKRDGEAQKIVRRAIYPRLGNQLLEVDYSGIEVSIAACYHKDPTMVEYLEKKFDMHGDIASQIFDIDNFNKHDKEQSVLRAAAKNTFVFPQFYGDYYKNNAIGMCGTWLQLPQTKWTDKMGIPLYGEPLGRHMRKIGIKSFDSFVNKIKAIERDFWTNRFPQYAAWKEEWYQMYLRYGYVPLKTGFVCRGLMSKNDVINYPVQGAAFHCLLWSFIEINKEIKRQKLKTRLVGQIHDAMVFDVYPPELEKIGYIVQKICTIGLRKHFDWINVPLSLEADLCGIDKSWADKEEWKLPEINGF